MALVSLAVTGVAANSLPAAGDTPPADAFRFVSMTDFLNADIGDVTGTRYYRAGQPNSTNPSYETAIATVLDAVRDEGTPHVLADGDFVEGHWGVDTAKTGTFGPVTTESQKLAAVRLAADTYYRQTLARFTGRGLNVYPAVGDHELGDNPWRRADGGITAFKWRNVGVFKAAYSRTMMTDAAGAPRFVNRPEGQAAGTAYAVRPHPEVQFVSLDVFRRSNTDVVAQLDGKQLAWLTSVLATARADGVDWIIVQGHTPIIGPIRRAYSSGLMYTGGQGSALWRVLKEYGVNVYFSGEFHDITAHYVDGIAQITHGGLIQRGQATYVVADVAGTTMTLTVKRFAGTADLSELKLWQTDTLKNKASTVTLPAAAEIVGTMVLDSSTGLVERTGLMEEYTG